jgi:hypothetical protein
MADREQRDRELIAEVIGRADPAQVARIMCGPEIEFAEDFFGFLHVYAGAALIAPPDALILDFGCYTGIQSVLFEDARQYIGIDTYDGPRYEAPGVAQHVKEIRTWIQTERWARYEGNVLAICSYVPDKRAAEMVRETFENVVVFYPHRRGRVPRISRPT